MAGNTGLLSISWKNHSSALIHNLNNFLLRESYCDATIICESRHIKVHRLVLSTCSDYFKEIFDNIFCTHPFIVLKDIGLMELEALVDYMYKGKVNVYENRLSLLMTAAEYLKIKGLGVSDSELPTGIKISKKNVITESDSTNTLCDESRTSRSTSLSKSTDQEMDKDTTEQRNKRKSDSHCLNEKLSNPSIKSKKLKGSQSNSPKIAYKKVMTISQKRNQDILEKEKPASISNMDVVKDKNSSQVEPVVVLERNLQSDVDEPSELLDDEENPLTIDLNADLVSENDDASTFQEESSDSSALDDSSLGLKYRHKCPDCNFCAKYPSELIAHTKTHTTSAKSFKCGHCDFRTHKKALFQNHMKIHNAAKPFKCKNCPFRASLNISLKKHEEKFCKGRFVKIKGNIVYETMKGQSQDGTNRNVLTQSHLGRISGDTPSQGHLMTSGDTGSPCQLKNSVSDIPSQHSQDQVDKNVLSESFLDRPTNMIPPIDLDKTAKDIHQQRLLGKNYFLCAFCPHKTTKKSLLASHVATQHQDS